MKDDSFVILPQSLSIITNFGCDQDCWYCISKKYPRPEINNHVHPNFDTIENYLKKYRPYYNKVSISGGGDPLYSRYVYDYFWDYIFYITSKLNMKLDIHTRIYMHDNIFWKGINKAVISSDEVSDCEDVVEYVINFSNVRIVHVVTKNTTDQTIQDYLKYIDDLNKRCGTRIVQFSLKKLVGFDDNGNFEKFQKKYSDIFFLENRDYNLYLFPDGEVYTTFLEGGLI